MSTTYKISGMICAACIQLVHDSLIKIAGVKKVSVDRSQGQATLETQSLNEACNPPTWFEHSHYHKHC
jgi:copper chaperone CopZ